MVDGKPVTGIEVDGYVPIYVRLREELRKIISTRASGDALPTIEAIKKQFKVSQPTVERAIQDLRAEGVVTSRRGSGIYVTQQAKLFHAGVVFDADILNNEFGDFYRLLIKALQTLSDGTPIVLRHYIADLLDATERDRHSAVVHDLRDRRLDTLIILVAYWRRSLRTSLPVIGFGDLPQTTHRVHLDQVTTVRQGVEELAKQGRRRIAFFGPTQFPRAENENRTFEQVMSACGLVPRREWMLKVGGWGATEAARSGADAFRAIWSLPGEKPDGLVCIDEYATRGLLDAAPEFGTAVGRDVSVVTHASKGVALLAQAPVTRIEFDPGHVAREMIALVEAFSKGAPCATDILVPPCGLTEGSI